MISWHRVGQIVVCIEGFEHKLDDITPSKDQILTIREVKFGSDGIGFTFEEIVNVEREYDDEVGEPYFDADGFRPVKPTSIESLRSLLITPEMEKPEPVLGLA